MSPGDAVPLTTILHAHTAIHPKMHLFAKDDLLAKIVILFQTLLDKLDKLILIINIIIDQPRRCRSKETPEDVFQVLLDEQDWLKQNLELE